MIKPILVAKCRAVTDACSLWQGTRPRRTPLEPPIMCFSANVAHPGNAADECRKAFEVRHTPSLMEACSIEIDLENDTVTSV